MVNEVYNGKQRFTMFRGQWFIMVESGTMVDTGGLKIGQWLVRTTEWWFRIVGNGLYPRMVNRR